MHLQDKINKAVYTPVSVAFKRNAFFFVAFVSWLLVPITFFYKAERVVAMRSVHEFVGEIRSKRLKLEQLI